MKYLKYFLILFLVPFIVLAEECDISKITITSMEQSGIEGNTEVINEPTFEDRNIKLDLKMYEVGDSIAYDITVKNDSKEDYMIDEDTFTTDSDYIEYSLKTNDNTNVVKPNSTKKVTLVVTYKKEVEDNLLTNNKFNATNSLNLSLNTSEKEKELDIITTDNIKESLDPKEINNPITSVTSILLISFILLTTIITAYILIKRKNKYTKYLLVLLSMILIPTVYAICKCDIKIQTTIEIEKRKTLFDTMVGLSNEENACVTKYEGEVTDEVGKTVSATNVYYDSCEDKRYVVFGGFCWQVIRTTETGGTKILYDGEVVDGKCETTRTDVKGITNPYPPIEETNFSDQYLYGNSFTYDLENETFTLVDTNLATWSDATYEDLLGKYTCKNTTGTCDILYLVGRYKTNTNAYAARYSIGLVNYALIGKSPFNVNPNTPATVGYMFNNYMDYAGQTYPVNTSGIYKSGDDFTYDETTNSYTVSGRTRVIDDWHEDYEIVYHYTCLNESGTCNTLYYILTPKSREIYAYELTNGDTVPDLISPFLEGDNINKNDSAIKKFVETWYANNFTQYTEKLEDAVYCSPRNLSFINAATSFVPYGSKSLICERVNDQFAVTNNKAKLKYPIGLLEVTEKNIIAQNMNSSHNVFGLHFEPVYPEVHEWWMISPHSFEHRSSKVSMIHEEGAEMFISVNSALGVRPVISLKQNNIVLSGTGLETDPWIIK